MECALLASLGNAEKCAREERRVCVYACACKQGKGGGVGNLLLLTAGDPLGHKAWRVLANFAREEATEPRREFCEILRSQKRVTRIRMGRASLDPIARDFIVSSLDLNPAFSQGVLGSFPNDFYLISTTTLRGRLGQEKSLSSWYLCNPLTATPHWLSIASCSLTASSWERIG